jgi:hypothetical protein
VNVSLYHLRQLGKDLYLVKYIAFKFIAATAFLAGTFAISQLLLERKHRPRINELIKYFTVFGETSNYYGLLKA